MRGILLPLRNKVPLCGGVGKARGGLFHCTRLFEFIYAGGVCIRYTRWGVHYARPAGVGCDTTGCCAGGRIARWA